MKKIRMLSAVALIAFSTACTPLLFTTIQPEGCKPLTSFPAELRGIYMEKSSSDKQTIEIRENSIFYFETKQHHYPFHYLSDSTSYILKGNRVYIDSATSFPAVINNDTVSFTVSKPIELFLSDSFIITTMNGYYFWNLKENGIYSVIFIKLSGGNIIKGLYFEDQADVKLAKKILNAKTIYKTDNPENSVSKNKREIDSYLASPSPEQLMKFIEKGGFSGNLFELEKMTIK